MNRLDQYLFTSWYPSHSVLLSPQPPGVKGPGQSLGRLPSTEEIVFVDRRIIGQGWGIGIEAHPHIQGNLAPDHAFKLIARSAKGPPFYQVIDRSRRHALRQGSRGSLGNRAHAGQEVHTPTFDGDKSSDIRERLLQGAS